MKGKFDFKDLMVRRGEMIAGGVVLLMVAYFVFDAFGPGVLKPGREPEDFKGDIQRAEAVMENGTIPPNPVRVPDLTHEQFKPGDLPDPGVFRNQRKRGQPTFFSVEDARACAGIGPFAFKPVGGAKRPTGGEFRELAKGRELDGFQASERDTALNMRWIAVVALVPVAKQQANFNSHFFGTIQTPGHEAKDDELVYGPPIIERAEVVSPQAGVALVWVELAAKGVVDTGLLGDPEWVAARGGRKQVGGVVSMDEKFANKVLTSPLPPLLMTDWTEACVLHAPEIAMLADESEKKPEDVKRKADPRRPNDVFGKPPAEKVAAAPKDDGEAAEVVQYQLFRFFDYTVEPGKTYVYRVKLHMLNPNFDIKLRFLENAVAQSQTSYSDDWSQPTQPATVPIASGVLAGVLNKRAVGNDRARMIVIDRDPVTGLEGHKEMTRRVGHLAHFPLPMDVALGEAIYEGEDGVKRTRPRRGDKLVGEVLVLDPLRRKIRVDQSFESNVALLDVRGGADGAADEILVMDAQGNLSAHHSGNDAAEFKRRNDLVTAAGAEPDPDDPRKPAFKTQPDGGRKFRNKTED